MKFNTTSINENEQLYYNVHKMNTKYVVRYHVPTRTSAPLPIPHAYSISYQDEMSSSCKWHSQGDFSRTRRAKDQSYALELMNPSIGFPTTHPWCRDPRRRSINKWCAPGILLRIFFYSHVRFDIEEYEMMFLFLTI